MEHNGFLSLLSTTAGYVWFYMAGELGLAAILLLVISPQVQDSFLNLALALPLFPRLNLFLLPPHLLRLKALMLGAPLALMILGYLSDLGLGGLVVNESSSVFVEELILTLKPAIT